MADDIIEIDDYEVKDKQIIETDNEDDYQRDYNQKEYDNGYQGSINGFYKSISFSNTSLLIILMVIVLLVAIFIMTFD